MTNRAKVADRLTQVLAAHACNFETVWDESAQRFLRRASCLGDTCQWEVRLPNNASLAAHDAHLADALARAAIATFTGGRYPERVQAMRTSAEKIRSLRAEVARVRSDRSPFGFSTIAVSPDTLEALLDDLDNWSRKESS